MSETNNNVENVQENSIGSGEVLLEIKELTKKKLFWQRITACSAIVVAVIALVFGAIVIPQVEVTLSHINDTAIKAQETLSDAQGTLSEAQTMVTSIKEASENFDGLVKENGEGITNAVKSLSEIDFDGLNEAIKDLQEAVGPLASFMSRFR